MNYIRPMEGWIWPVEYSLPTPGKEHEPEAKMPGFYPALSLDNSVILGKLFSTSATVFPLL